MHSIRQLLRRSRRRIAEDIDAELALHLELRAAELARRGVPPHEARREAEREFGDLDYTRRYCEEMDMRAERTLRATEAARDLWQDLAYAARTLRRSPGFTAVALLTLTLAIGANTAIFSVAGAVLLRPLPYRDPGALVALYEDHVPTHEPHSDMSAADLADYRTMQRTLTGIAIMTRAGEATYHPPKGDPTIVTAMRVSANMFDVLGVGAARGRTFAADEDTPAKKHVAILGWGLWQRAFAGDTAAIGSSITLEDQTFQVIGVMPRGFSLGSNDELWIPLDLSRVMADVNRSRKMHFLFGIARVAPGVTTAGARADLNADARALEAKYPDANTGHYVTVEPLARAMAGDTRPAVLLLLAAAGLVLLIACANLANVTLARTLTRRREMAVRAAIGAGRGRIARQLLTESLLLAAAGGALGALLAFLATPALLALDPAVLPPLAHVTIDARVFAFSAAVSVLTGVLCGLAPALSGARTDLQSALKEGRGASGGGVHAHPLRRALVVSQIAIAAILLAGAGLLVRSFVSLQHVQLGFEPEHLLTARIALSGSRYDSLAAFNGFWDGVVEQLEATPGIRAAGFTGGLPLEGSATSSLRVDGEANDPNHLPEVGYISIVGDYFKAMGIPLIAGRDFAVTDLPKGPRVVIVSQALAKQYFPAGDAIGRRIHLGPDPNDPAETIIGIAADVRQVGLDHEPRPTVYVDNRQEMWGQLTAVIRTTGDPALAVPAVRRVTAGIDPLLALRRVRTMEDVYSASLAARRFSLVLICGFASLAVALAAVGVYGVLAYTVSSRRREFGIRLALGASASSVLRLVMRQGLAWLAIGLSIGMLGALASGRVIGGMLYGVAPNDFFTLVAVGAVLLGVVASACLIPAIRATKVDPAATMRAD